MKINTLIQPLELQQEMVTENYTDLQTVYNEAVNNPGSDFRASALINNMKMTLWYSADKQGPVDAYKSLVQSNKISGPEKDAGFWIRIIRKDGINGAVEFVKFLVGCYEREHKKKHAKTAQDQFDVVYKAGTVKVYEPKTYEAARKLGRGTHWCTSGSTSEHFDSYKSDGELYYVFIESNPLQKYAIQISDALGGEEGTAVWTAGNDEIPIEDFNEVLRAAGVDVDDFWDSLWSMW